MMKALKETQNCKMKIFTGQKLSVIDQIKQDLGLAGKIFDRRLGYSGMPTLEELERETEELINI